MKKLILAGLLASAVCGLVRAGELEDNVGIGVGSLIFQGQTGLVQQVLAATTNGIFGNQTFAISSGTLGAKRPDALVKNDELRKFVAENMDNLAKDMARGQGETLTVVVELMGVPKAEQAACEKKFQKNFRVIYPTAKVTHLDVLKNIEKVVAG